MLGTKHKDRTCPFTLDKSELLLDVQGNLQEAHFRIATDLLQPLLEWVESEGYLEELDETRTFLPLLYLDDNAEDQATVKDRAKLTITGPRTALQPIQTFNHP